MAVGVEIKTGSCRIVDYFLSPITKATSEGNDGAGLQEQTEGAIYWRTRPFRRYGNRMQVEIKLAAVERPFKTEPTTPARLRFAGVLALSTVFNLAIIYALTLLTFIESPDAPIVEEIPVEILREPPTPQSPETLPPKPPTPPPQQTLDEKPATDAPRARSDSKEERDASDIRKAPREAPPADQAPASPTPDQAPRPETGTSQTTPAAQQQRQEEAEAETVENAAPATGAKAEPMASAPAQAPPRRGVVDTQYLASAFAPLPEFEFDTSARNTPVAGGKAKSTYLTVLYGMIMPHMRVPSSAENRPTEGVVSFVVDEWGHVARLAVTKPSGLPQLDMAAMAAVKNAAPFPSPPRHQSIGLSFSYGSKRAN